MNDAFLFDGWKRRLQVRIIFELLVKSTGRLDFKILRNILHIGQFCVREKINDIQVLFLRSRGRYDGDGERN